MKELWSKWKGKAAFVLACCIILGGIAKLPMPNLSAAGLEAVSEENSTTAAAETDTEEKNGAAAVTGENTEDTGENEKAESTESAIAEPESTERETVETERETVEEEATEAEEEVLKFTGGVDRTDDTAEVGITISEFTVLNASGGKLNCTGPVTTAGASVYDASSNAYYDVDKVKFRMGVSVKKPWQSRSLTEGDFVSLPIPKGFSVFNSGNMQDASGTIIGTYKAVDGKLIITFAESVNPENRNDNIKGGIYVEMTFDADALKGGDKAVTVVPARGTDELPIILKLPEEPDTVDGISKTGNLNPATNEITWTIKVGTAALSKGVSLDGVELAENLPGELERTDVEAVNAVGDKVTVNVSNDILTLAGDNAAAPVTVTVKTNITEKALTDAINRKQTELKLTNKVSMGSSDPSVKFGTNTSAESSVSVKLSPRVEKQGVQIDSNTIRWTIKVNDKEAVRVYHGYVKDELAAGLKYKKGSITCSQGTVTEVPDKPQTSGSWPAHKLWVETKGDAETLYFYMAEDTEAPYTITFDTVVSDGFAPGNAAGGGEPKVHNAATVYAEFPTGTGTIPVEYGIPGIDTVFNTAKINKEVSADETKATGQLTWTIYPSVRTSSYTEAKMTDVIKDNQRYCRNTLKIYEKEGESWKESTSALTAEGVSSVVFTEDTKTLTLVYTKANAESNRHSTTLSDYKIVYETDALTYLQTNNTSDTYENTAKLEVKDGGSTYTSEGTASAKLQNNWVTKKTKFEYNAEGVPCFHYTITVNGKGIKDLTNVEIKDSIENTIKISSNETNISGDWQFDDTATAVFVGSQKVTEGIIYSGDKREVTITFNSLSEKATVELYAKYVGEKEKLTTGIYANQKVYSDNTAEVKSAQVAAEGGVAISVNSNTKNKEEMDNTLVQKKCINTATAGGTKFTWRVIINPNSGKMGTVTIKDTISKTQKYIEDSVKLYDVTYKDGILQPTGSGMAKNAVFTVNKTARSMELTIDAGDKPLILEYQTALLDSTIEIATNDVQVSEKGIPYGTGTGEKDLSGGNWGSLTSVGTLILQKQDASIGSDMPLAGAEFTIYEDEEGKKPVDVGVTGIDGTVTFLGLDVPTGTLTRTYYYRETVTPEGYEPDTEIHKVIVEKGLETTDTVENIRQTQQTDQSSKVTLTKKFTYINTAGREVKAIGKQAAFTLMFYPYGKGNAKGAKPVSLTGENGSYTYSSAPGDGTAVTKIKNNAETGGIIISGLPWGYYGIIETETAAGFRLETEELYFEIINNEDMEVVYSFGDNADNDNGVLSNTAIQFQAAKYEAGTTIPVSGIRLQICGKNTDGTRGDVVTDALNGNAAYEWDTKAAPETIYNLPAGTYLLHEDIKGSTNLNYAIAEEDVEFTVSEDGTIEGTADSIVKMYDKTINLKIAKVDQFDEAVANATIQMTGTSTNYSETGTTTADNNILSFGNLQRNGEYILTENAAPDAEHLAIRPITVKVSEDGNSFTFTQEGENGETAVLELSEDGKLHVIDRLSGGGNALSKCCI